MCCQTEEVGMVKKDHNTNVSFLLNHHLRKEYCIFAQVVQHQWLWNSLMNRYLLDDIISPSQTLVVCKITVNAFSIFFPVSRDISPALILMLMSINLLIWRQLRLMPFVRVRACAFHWASCWFALLSVRVIKPQREVEHLIDFFNLFHVENGSNGIHSYISKAHTWAVNTHTQTSSSLTIQGAVTLSSH